MKVILLKDPRVDDKTSQIDDPYATLLANFSHTVHFLSVLSHSYGTAGEQDRIREQLDDVSSYGFLVFTSAKGVTGCQIVYGGVIPTRLLSIPVFVVGLATQVAAVNAGFLNVFAPPGGEGHAEALSLYIADIVNSKNNRVSSTVELPRGKTGLLLLSGIRIPTMTTRLSEYGIPHEELFIYHTSPSRNMWPELESAMNLQPDCLVLFSPSGVTCLQNHIVSLDCTNESHKILLDRVFSCRFISIGRTTENAIIQHNAKFPTFPIQCVGVCATPTPDGLLACLANL